MAVCINSIYHQYISVYGQYAAYRHMPEVSQLSFLDKQIISVSRRSWSRDPELVVVGKNVSWIDFGMRIPTIRSDLFSSPTYCASDALDFAIGLTGTKWTNVPRSSLNFGTEESALNRGGPISLFCAFWIHLICVFAAISVFSFDLSYVEGVQYVLVIPSAVPVSSRGLRLRALDVTWGRCLNNAPSRQGGFSLRHVVDVFLGVLLHGNAHVC